MTLRWGFKAEGERIATEVRTELALTPTCRLDPLRLAKHLEIPVLTIQDCICAGGRRERLNHLLQGEPESFSAVTVFVGTRRLILHNESHAPTRQANDIAHEIAHCLLGHPPTPVVDGHGCRLWNAQVEEEATWLAGALLVPREGARKLAYSGMSVAKIAVHFAVSEQLCRWRVNQTGITRQLRSRPPGRRRQGSAAIP